MDGFLLKNREEAGILLSEKLSKLKPAKPLVLAIPRGGVVLGCKIAEALNSGLDIITPRKLHDQYEEELALGAIMFDGSVYLNDEVIAIRKPTASYLAEEKERGAAESLRRMNAYRGERPYPEISGKSIILVDDGIATGATMMLASRWVKEKGARNVIVAVPVIPEDVLNALREIVDDVVYLFIPSLFSGIGQFYSEFNQVSDNEVIELLDKYWKAKSRDKKIDR